MTDEAENPTTEQELDPEGFPKREPIKITFKDVLWILAGLIVPPALFGLFCLAMALAFAR